MPNATYLIRADFFYGGYDAAVTAPTFQIAIDATVVANITTEKTNGGYEEFTVLTQNNVTYFCLLRDSSDTNPFISGLSLRPIKAYTNMDANLVNFNYYRTLHRLNLGGPSLVRYVRQTSLCLIQSSNTWDLQGKTQDMFKDGKEERERERERIAFNLFLLGLYICSHLSI
jgi:hypothetical protein